MEDRIPSPIPVQERVRSPDFETGNHTSFFNTMQRNPPRVLSNAPNGGLNVNNMPRQGPMLMNHIQLMIGQLQMMANQVDTSSSQLQQVTLELSQCRGEVHRLSQELRQRDQRIRTVKDENELLSANVLQNERDNELLREENRNLRNENTRLQALESEMNDLRNMIVTKDRNMDGLQTKNRSLEITLAEQSQRIEILSANLHKSNEDKNRLTNELVSLQEKHLDLEKQKESLQADLKNEIAKERVSQEIEKLTSAKEDTHQKLETLKETHAQILLRTKKAESNASKWKKQHELMRAELVQAKSSHNRLMKSLYAERHELESRVNRLETNQSVYWIE